MKSLLLFCSLEAALRLVVCSVPSLKDIYTSHCLSRWQNIISTSLHDVQPAALWTLLWSGACHPVLTSVCVSSFDRNAFIYSPVTQKSSSAGLLCSPLIPNYSLFIATLAHCWALQVLIPSKRPILFPQAVKHPHWFRVYSPLTLHCSIHLICMWGGRRNCSRKTWVNSRLWRFRLALENWKGTLIVRARGGGEMGSDRLPSLTFYK